MGRKEVCIMKRHECINTIWTKRDQEFWWDGVKFGTIQGVVIGVVVVIDGIRIAEWIKHKRSESKKLKK